MKPPRLSVARLMIAVAAVAVVMAVCIPPVARISEFRRLRGQIGTTIRNLRPTDPRTVSLPAWEDSLVATLTAYAATCSSRELVTTDEMYRLRDDLAARLGGKVDQHTLLWIVDRLGEVGPHGERSIERPRQAIIFSIVMPRQPRSLAAGQSPSP